jgi:hypothetical protein
VRATLQKLHVILEQVTPALATFAQNTENKDWSLLKLAIPACLEQAVSRQISIGDFSASNPSERGVNSSAKTVQL